VYFYREEEESRVFCCFESESSSSTWSLCPPNLCVYECVRQHGIRAPGEDVRGLLELTASGCFGGG
jgi:hypothetical protein